MQITVNLLSFHDENAETKDTEQNVSFFVGPLSKGVSLKTVLLRAKDIESRFKNEKIFHF